MGEAKCEVDSQIFFSQVILLFPLFSDQLMLGGLSLEDTY